MPSGKTLRGAYYAEAHAADMGEAAAEAESFVFTLPSKPIVHYLALGTTPPTECPGSGSSPEAAPGHLCVYENSKGSNTGAVQIVDPETSAAGGTSEEGFGVQVTSTAIGDYFSRGTWAVTSP